MRTLITALLWAVITCLILEMCGCCCPPQPPCTRYGGPEVVVPGPDGKPRVLHLVPGYLVKEDGDDSKSVYVSPP